MATNLVTRDRARDDKLRGGMEGIVNSMRAAKERGEVSTWAVKHHMAERLLLEYIDNGYIKLLWEQMEALKF